MHIGNIYIDTETHMHTGVDLSHGYVDHLEDVAVGFKEYLR